MAEVKFTARDEQFIAACTRMNGAVGEMSAKINIQLVNAFKQADYVANNFAKGIGRVEKEFADAQKKLAADAVAAQREIQEAQKKIADSAAASAKRQTDAIEAVSKRYKDNIATVQKYGQNLTTYVTLPIVGLGVAMANTFMNIDTLDRGIASVMGSAQAAQREFVNLREVAKLPGLGLEEAGQGSVMLQAAGMSASFARRELLSVGNALATVGKGKFELERVNDQLVQIYNKTSGFGEDVTTISQSLPQLRKVMLEAFGTMDTAEISKKFSGKEFVEKLVVELEKLPKATGGFKNAWENLTDSLKIGGYEIFKIAEQSFDFTGKLDGLAKSVDGLVGKFKELSPETQTAILSITGIAAAAGPLAVAIGSIARVLPLLATGFRALMGPIGLISTGIILLASNWDTVKTKAYEALYSTGVWVGELLVKMGKALNSTTLLNEGMAQLAKSSQFRGTYLRQQSTASVIGDPNDGEAIRSPLARAASLGGGASEAELAKTEQNISKLNTVLDRQKANLDKLKDAAEEYSKELRKLRDIMLGMDGLKAMERKGISSPKLDPMSAIGAQMNTTIKGISGVIPAFETELLSLRATITDSLKQTATDAFVGMGEVVGAMISGTAGIGGLGKMLGSVVGGTLQQIGKALIGFGVAKLKIDSLIAVPGLGAGAAIAGGALIVGLGSALKSITAPKAFAKGGLVGSATNAIFGEYIGAANNNEVVTPLSNLLGIIQKAIQPVMLQGVGVGGGRTSYYSESRLRGADIYTSQLRENRVNTALRG